MATPVSTDTTGVRLLVPLLLLVASCGGGGGPGGPTRSFVLGFTPFPHDGGLAGLLDAFAVIAADADLGAFHHDNGVPWDAMLAGDPHPEEEFLRGQVAELPTGHRRFLAVTPIHIDRSRLAPFPGDAPLTPPWDGYDFDHPDVMAAFLNYCEAMLAIHDPDWFAYAIEANFLFELTPSQWDAFLRLAEHVYSTLKARHPDLPVVATISTEAFWNNGGAGAHRQAVLDLLQYSDLVAISSYPILTTGDGDPRNLPEDFYDAIRALAPAKPFAFAESGWPAEPLDAPYPLPLAIDASDQRAFYERLFAECDEHEARFLICFLPRDWDTLWNSGTVPQTGINRFFRDIGLIDGAGNERPALDLWREHLARPLR